MPLSMWTPARHLHRRIYHVFLLFTVPDYSRSQCFSIEFLVKHLATAYFGTMNCSFEDAEVELRRDIHSNEKKNPAKHVTMR